MMRKPCVPACCDVPDTCARVPAHATISSRAMPSGPPREAIFCIVPTNSGKRNVPFDTAAMRRSADRVNIGIVVSP